MSERPDDILSTKLLPPSEAGPPKREARRVLRLEIILPVAAIIASHFLRPVLDPYVGPYVRPWALWLYRHFLS